MTPLELHAKAQVSELTVDQEAALIAGSRWQHKNGNFYTILHLANDKSTQPGYVKTVVYKGDNGNIWTRPAWDWARSMTLVCTPLYLGPTPQTTNDSTPVIDLDLLMKKS